MHVNNQWIINHWFILGCHTINLSYIIINYLYIRINKNSFRKEDWRVTYSIRTTNGLNPHKSYNCEQRSIRELQGNDNLGNHMTDHLQNTSRDNIIYKWKYTTLDNNIN